MENVQVVTDKIFEFCQQHLPSDRKSNLLQFYLEQQILPYLFEYPKLENICGYNHNLYSSQKIEFAKRRLSLQQATVNFIKLCEQQNQKCIFLKGIAFEDLYYPKDLPRKFSDIDILVDSQFYIDADKRFFDVHTQILDRPLRKYLSYQIAIDSCQLVEGKYCRYITLSDVHNLLLMIAHGTKHQWCRLRWILDIVWYLKSEKVTLQTLNDASIICRNLGMQKAFKVGLILSSRFIDNDHYLHNWLKTEVSNSENKIADSLVFDLVRKRNQNIKEKIINIHRISMMQDNLKGAMSYLLDRIVAKLGFRIF